MKHLLKRSLMTTALATLTASASLANPGFYGGIGLSYNSTEAVNAVGTSDGNYAGLELMMGVKPFAQLPEIGIEAQISVSGDNTLSFTTGASCNPASGPYFCSIDRMARLRTVYATDLANDMELSFALGWAYASGQRATSSTTTTDVSANGWSAGVGLAFDVGEGKIRGMINLDDLDGGGVAPSAYSAKRQSLDIMYIREF